MVIETEYQEKWLDITVFQWGNNCKGQIFIKFHIKNISKSWVVLCLLVGWFPGLCEEILLDK